MLEEKKRLVIVDANALIHRAFHALPPLTKKDGKLINAAYGFTMIFLKMLKDLKPDYLAVAFDHRAPTFRHEVFKPYKAQRVKQPQELYDQIPIVQDILRAFQVPLFQQPGYEADDLIGTICRHPTIKRKALETIIVTGDLDALQLVDERTKVYTLKSGVTNTAIYDEDAVKDRYDNLNPSQLTDLRGLRGDPSDNIPGVKGIGEKGAISLLRTFGTIENLYRKIKERKEEQKEVSEKIKTLLLQHQDDAFLSKRLAMIVTDVPLEFKLERCRFGAFERQAVAELFQKLEFQSLLSKLPAISERETAESWIERMNHQGVSYFLITEEKSFQDFIEMLKKQTTFVFDTETTDIDSLTARLLGISFCWNNGQAFYVSVSPSFLLKLRPIFEDSSIRKFGHNLKFDIKVLKETGIEIRGIAFDTMIASYLLNPSSRQHSLSSLAFSEFGYTMMPIEALIGERGKKQRSMEEIPTEQVSWYSCEDADYTFRLVEPLKKKLEEKTSLDLFKNIEMPLIPILARMERRGINIDLPFLRELSETFSRELDQIQNRIYKLTHTHFNINSPIQLKEVLFEKLKIPTTAIKKIKTGLSTAQSELEKLRGQHPVIDLLLEYREYAKLKSTYTDALPQLVNPKTGRIHTDFNQTIAATGRLSSSNPNLQNIPIRTVVGREIRKAFVTEENKTLLSLDYSQLELRIAASLANDEKMIEFFNQGIDIHRQTAAEIHGVSIDDVTPEMRYAAKEVNFGILYGMGAGGLAWRTGIGKEKARAFIEKYFEVFEGIQRYIEETKALARSLGYVETLFGRRRYLPEMNSGVAQVRSAAERMAVNTPIQGSEADLIKMAMIAVQEVLDQYPKNSDGNIAAMILQVHDELVFEVQQDQCSAIALIIKEKMETIDQLKVPLVVEMKAGKNWGEMTHDSLHLRP